MWVRCDVFTLSFDWGNKMAAVYILQRFKTWSTVTVFPVLDEALYTIRCGSSHVSDSCGFVAPVRLNCLAKLFP